MEKLTRTARRLDKFIRIIFVLTVIIAVVVVIGSAAWLYIFNSDMPIEFQSALSLGNVQFMLTPEYLPSNDAVAAQYFSGLLLGFAAAVMTLFRLKIIRNILKPMKEAKPFHNTVSTNLRKLGWIEIVAGIAAECIEFVQYMALTVGYDLNSIFLGDSISVVTTNMTIDLDFVLLACVLFLASYIFRYGEQLQQLSDETL